MVLKFQSGSYGISCKRLFAVLCLVSFLPSWTGCAVWRPVTTAKPPSLPEEYRAYYDYPRLPYPAEVIGTEETKHYILKTVEIPLNLNEELTVPDLEEYKAYVTQLAETDQKTAKDLKLRYTNRIDLYLPKDMKPGEKRPVVIISPILGGNMVVDHFAAYYTGRGMISALVHRKRVKWVDDEGVDQLERYLRKSIIRLRQAVDWVSEQPEADADRIGAFGISYGAILHSVLAAMEPRIKYHVLAMPAAPLPEVIVNCPDRAMVKLRKKMREVYGWDEEKMQRELERTLKTDPIYFAPYVPRHKVQVYIALFDRVVGVGRSFKLWKAMGKPSLKLLPFGHYGGILVFPYLQTRSYISLKHRLK